MTPAPKAQRPLGQKVEKTVKARGPDFYCKIVSSLTETAAMKSQQYTRETSKITTWLTCYHRQGNDPQVSLLDEEL